MHTRLLHKISALFLLMVLAFSIVPMESFHQHDGPEQVCTESEAHVESPSQDCPLADFLLPQFKLNQQIQIEAQPLGIKVLAFDLEFKVKAWPIHLFSPRAPPGLSV